MDGSYRVDYFDWSEGGGTSSAYYDADGSLREEVYANNDGSSTRFYIEDDGTEVYETHDVYGQRTIERWNPETGDFRYAYEDYYGNMITEYYDAETGYTVREVEDPNGQVFVENYDESGEQVGETEVRDTEGFRVIDDVENDDGTITQTKEDADGTTIVEVIDFETGIIDVTITDADGNVDTRQRDLDGNIVIADTVDGNMHIRTIETPEGESIVRVENYDTGIVEVTSTWPAPDDCQDWIDEDPAACDDYTYTYEEDPMGNRIDFREVLDDGSTETYMTSADGLTHYNIIDHADGSREETIWYYEEDSWEHTTEYNYWGADGSYRHEYTDQWGETHTEEYNANGFELLEDWCDDDTGDCFMAYIDADGTYVWSASYSDGTWEEYMYHNDGTYCSSGNLPDMVYGCFDMMGREVISQDVDSDGNQITVVMD